MDEQKPITELLKGLMKTKGIGSDRLSGLTGIPKRFITSLLQGSFEQLPAKPYVRGYLFKIAEVLGADPQTLWNSYRHSADLFSSGEHDRLPSNRFALKPIRSGVLIIVAVILIGIGFLGFRFNDILGTPTIEVALPESTSDETILVTGSVKSGDSVTLNGEILFPSESGEFQKRVQLEPGLNTLEFQVERYLGKKSTIVKQVFYQSSSPE